MYNEFATYISLLLTTLEDQVKMVNEQGYQCKLYFRTVRTRIEMIEHLHKTYTGKISGPDNKEISFRLHMLRVNTSDWENAPEYAGHGN